MKKGKTMQSTRILMTSACLAGALLPASAHHGSEASGAAHYLAFWNGYRSPVPPTADGGLCLDGAFWEKAFISLYAQGERISAVR